jgi:hypothetical protein
MTKILIFLLIILQSFTKAGLISYGACQTGCNTLVVACYAAAGFTFGTVTGGAGVPAVIVACNAGLGTCMAGCAALLVLPI